MTTADRFAMPDKLPELAKRHESASHAPVRFRMPSWEQALSEIPGRPTRHLSDPVLTTQPTEDRYRALGDRVVTRDAVVAACAAADMADDQEVVAAYVLVMAWGSGTSNSRSLRNTRKSLEDVPAAATMLRESATALRPITDIADPQLAEVHHRFSLPGVGEAFFTKWFAFAGYSPGRDWQPLILDSRVRATLHQTLGVWLNQLTDVRNDRQRYVAYLIAMHRWAAKLPQPMNAPRLEWILFSHRGTAV